MNKVDGGKNTKYCMRINVQCIWMRFASGWNELQYTLYLDGHTIYAYIGKLDQNRKYVCATTRGKQRREMEMEEEDCTITTGQMNIPRENDTNTQRKKKIGEREREQLELECRNIKICVAMAIQNKYARIHNQLIVHAFHMFWWVENGSDTQFNIQSWCFFLHTIHIPEWFGSVSVSNTSAYIVRPSWSRMQSCLFCILTKKWPRTYDMWRQWWSGMKKGASNRVAHKGDEWERFGS